MSGQFEDKLHLFANCAQANSRAKPNNTGFSVPPLASVQNVSNIWYRLLLQRRPSKTLSWTRGHCVPRLHLPLNGDVSADKLVPNGDILNTSESGRLCMCVLKFGLHIGMDEDKWTCVRILWQAHVCGALHAISTASVWCTCQCPPSPPTVRCMNWLAMCLL